MYNILVFPAGTEIGLEIHKALSFSKEINLFGANLDVPNHAPFVYDKYFTISGIDSGILWINELNEIIRENNIDYIYPAYDDIILELARNREKINCNIIAPDFSIAEITRSKIKTYSTFCNTKLPVPKYYALNEIGKIDNFPVFIKPDIGQGSQGAKKVENMEILISILGEYGENIVISENLVGDEFTVDCFSSAKGGLMFVGGRKRIRSKNGISMSSETLYKKEFGEYAQIIQEKLNLIGAWFYQVKYDQYGVLKLLEIAPRISGTMATNRVRGVNFPLLSIYEYEGIHTELILNNYGVYIDRALENKYKINIEYDVIYVDLDDTIIINGIINFKLISFLYKSLNESKKIILLTKHNSQDLENYLKKNRIYELFDTIIHIDMDDSKYKYINEKKSIFIDDSFSERKEVFIKTGISVFDLHMIESLF